jgi:hypothetical protein
MGINVCHSITKKQEGYVLNPVYFHHHKIINDRKCKESQALEGIENGTRMVSLVFTC